MHNTSRATLNVGAGLSIFVGIGELVMLIGVTFAVLLGSLLLFMSVAFSGGNPTFVALLLGLIGVYVLKIVLSVLRIVGGTRLLTAAKPGFARWMVSLVALFDLTLSSTASIACAVEGGRQLDAITITFGIEATFDFLLLVLMLLSLRTKAATVSQFF